MAQPQKYERTHDFTGDEQDEIDCGSINSELDGAALSINQIRDNLAAIQNDDLSLKAGIVTAASLSPEAANALSGAVDSKSEAATEAARRAEAAANEAIEAAAEAKDSAAAASDASGNASGIVASAIEIIKASADTQIERIERAGSGEIFKQGLSCLEQVWTLKADKAAGDTISIPDLTYMVGRHHLRLSWNGLVLSPGKQFEEVGEADQMSNQVKVLMPMSAGDELDAWVSILGYGASATEALTVAYEAQNSVADLSRRVVYKDEASASDGS